MSFFSSWFGVKSSNTVTDPVESKKAQYIPVEPYLNSLEDIYHHKNQYDTISEDTISRTIQIGEQLIAAFQHNRAIDKNKYNIINIQNNPLDVELNNLSSKLLSLQNDNNATAEKINDFIVKAWEMHRDIQKDYGEDIKRLAQEMEPFDPLEQYLSEHTAEREEALKELRLAAEYHSDRCRLFRCNIL